MKEEKTDPRSPATTFPATPKAEPEPKDKPKHVHKSPNLPKPDLSGIRGVSGGDCAFCTEIAGKPIPKRPTTDGIHQCQCRNELVR